MKVVHISDTHLSAQHRDFEDNFTLLVDEINALKPDLVINTGDVTVNGADLEADHRHARKLHEQLNCPYYVIPGNHDVGDNPTNEAHRPKQFPNAMRRQRFRDVWGEDYWKVDAGNLRLIGLNSQMFSTDSPDEQVQYEFLAQALAEADDRTRIAVFSHKPLFMESGDDQELTSRCITPHIRHKLLDILGDRKPVLFASGHMHQHRVREIDGTLHVWGASSAYILPEGFQPEIGRKQLGYVLYEISEDTIEATVQVPKGIIQHNLLDHVAPYGDLRPYVEGKLKYVS